MIGRYLTGEPVTRKWIDIDAISPSLPRSVVAAEDAKFCFHHGIDWNSVQEIIEDAQEGEVTRGGSTITQQVAKNLFLWPGRSVIRKGLEFPLALWVDFVLSKKRILNFISMSRNSGQAGNSGWKQGQTTHLAAPPRRYRLWRPLHWPRSCPIR